MNTRDFIGSIPAILRNDAKLYEGNLAHYYQITLRYATNLRNPYHNLRHPMHTMWLCYLACEFYRGELTPRQMRNLLVAAMLHDANHRGKMGPGFDDEFNIAVAIEFLREHIAPCDRPYFEAIASIIAATLYPHLGIRNPSPMQHIIRDADVSQVFDAAWLQQNIIGIAAESGRTPVDVLLGEKEFLLSIRYHTRWARKRFPEAVIRAKCREVDDMVAILSMP